MLTVILTRMDAVKVFDTELPRISSGVAVPPLPSIHIATASAFINGAIGEGLPTIRELSRSL